jgi:hypothetical protein
VGVAAILLAGAVSAGLAAAALDPGTSWPELLADCLRIVTGAATVLVVMEMNRP